MWKGRSSAYCVHNWPDPYGDSICRATYKRAEPLYTAAATARYIIGVQTDSNQCGCADAQCESRSSSAPHHGDVEGVAVGVGAGPSGLLGQRGSCPAAPQRPLHRRVGLRDGLLRHRLRPVQHRLGALVALDGCDCLLRDTSGLEGVTKQESPLANIKWSSFRASEYVCLTKLLHCTICCHT